MLFGVLAVFQPADAAINKQVNFQGRLTDANGNVVADGDYNMEFKLHNNASSSGGGQGTCSGSCLWMETRTTTKVTVSRGLFSIQLGEVASLASFNFNQDPLYLSVRVGGIGSPSWDSEMTPRHRLGSSPQAIYSADADALDGNDSTYFTNSSNQSSGTLNDARLSSNVALKNINNSFSAAQSITANGGKTTLALTSTGADTGITIGGDTTLYRADAGRLRTDAKLEVGTSLGIGVYDPSNARIALGGSGSSNGIVFGAGAAGSANLYKDGLSDALLKTDSSFQIDTRLGLGTDPTAGTARLQFANGTTAAGGIQFGSDTNLYRADTNQLKTDDTFDAAAYKVAGTAGASTTCTGGDVLTNQVVAGGIVTGGTCSAAATTTLQGAYNNDASGRADIVTTSAAKTVLIQAGSGFNSASLFEVQNASGGTVFVADSINNRVAIGKATADYTVDANGDINVASGVYRVAGTAGTSFGGTCGSGNVITNVSVSGGIVTGVTCAANSNTMQQAYDAGNTVLTTNARDISYTLANTATDANFNVNVASGSTSKFAVQYNGAETFSVGNTGQTVAAFAGNTPETQSWGSTTSMSNGQGGGFATGVTYNGYVYHIGGWDTLQNGARSQVTYARLNADGTVPASGQTGTWALTTSMPAARIVTGAAAANGYLYVIGGSTGGNNNGSNTTYYAKINKDGTLGSWTTASVALPANRASHSVSYYNGYLYVIGGTPTGANWTDGASGTSTVYYARVNADGSIGTWQSNANSLPQARIGHASVAANGYLYAIGGANTSSVIQSTVYYAKVNANGSTGAWASVGSSLNTARMHMGAVVMNGAAYVVGGLDSSNAISSIEYALLNANGTMGSWANSSNSLPAARQGAPAVAANGYILALSGYDTSSSTVNTVYRVSTPRLAIAGSLDLVSAIGENLAEGGSGGALTAGNTNVVGDLGVAGQANIDGGASVGGALAARDRGQLGVGIIGDGDLLMASSALWTAVHYGIPALVVVNDNSSFYNDEPHQAEVARHRGRPEQNSWIGMRISDPPVDLAGLAISYGCWAEGPVTEPEELAPALGRALKEALSGAVAVVHVKVAPR